MEKRRGRGTGQDGATRAEPRRDARRIGRTAPLLVSADRAVRSHRPETVTKRGGASMHRVCESQQTTLNMSLASAGPDPMAA